MHLSAAASSASTAAATAASAALNGGASAANSAANDAMSPFSGVLDNILQPASAAVPASAAAPATAAAPISFAVSTAANGDTADQGAQPDQVATGAQSTALPGAGGSGVTRLFPSQALAKTTPKSASAVQAAQSPAATAGSDSVIQASTTGLAAIALPGAASAPDDDSSTSTPSTKSVKTSSSGSVDQADGVSNAPLGAPLLAPPPLPLTQTPAPSSEKSGSANLGSANSGSANSGSAKARLVDVSASFLQTGVATDPSQITPSAGQAAAGFALPAGTTATQANAAQTPVDAASLQAAAQASVSQQPSAVAQFVGRPRSGPSGALASNATGSTGRTTSTAASSSGASSSGASPSSAVASAKAPGVGAANDQGAVTGVSSDSQSGEQDVQTSGQGAQAANLDVTDAGQTALVAAPAQATPSVDAPIASTPSAPAASDTVANLSAQIAQKAGGQTTRFDVQLDPVGLGRVNVSVEIDAKGAMSAALSFEKPEAASLLRSHSAELQQSLAQAGFDLSNSALSFSTADQDGGAKSFGQNAFLGAGQDGSGGQQSQGGQAQTAGRAFGAASFAADQADQITTASRSLTARGLDIRI